MKTVSISLRSNTATTLHLNHQHAVAELLGIPDEFAQLALIPMAYTLGTDFKEAPRKPLDSVLHRDRWQSTTWGSAEAPRSASVSAYPCIFLAGNPQIGGVGQFLFAVCP